MDHMRALAQKIRHGLAFARRPSVGRSDPMPSVRSALERLKSIRAPFAAFAVNAASSRRNARSTEGDVSAGHDLKS